MRKNVQLILITGVFVVLLVSQANGIGISPGRWTAELPEHVTGNTILEKAVTLYQDGPFSEVRLLDPDGLDAFFYNDLPTGASLFNENTLVVDWAQVGTSTLNLPYKVSIPDGWTVPDGPGTKNMSWGLVHQQLADPSQGGVGGIVGAVQQFAIIQSYEPRVYVENLSSSVAVGQMATVDLLLEDKNYAWFSMNSDHQWFSYEIDWDGDGSVDDSGTTAFDEAPFPYPQFLSLSQWISGIQTSSLALDHVYDVAGSYMASITIGELRGSEVFYGFNESTSLIIPIEVTPEPATLSILALSSFVLLKCKYRKKG